MPTKILHLKLKVQIDDQPPQELIENYLKGTKESAKKTYENLKEAVPDVATVIEKIIKPRVESHKSFFKPDGVTRRGTKVKDSLNPTQAEIEKQAKRWLKRMKVAHRYDSKEYIASIKNMAEYYAKEMTLLVLPFRGYKDKIRGVGPIAARWLTGDPTVVKRVSREEIIKGKPVNITQEAEKSRFRQVLINQLLSSGRQIIKKDYQPSEFIYGNAIINRLVTGYATNKFMPFVSGGTSYVDFIREDKELFLEVQVAVTE